MKLIFKILVRKVALVGKENPRLIISLRFDVVRFLFARKYPPYTTQNHH